VHCGRSPRKTLGVTLREGVGAGAKFRARYARPDFPFPQGSRVFTPTHILSLSLSHTHTHLRVPVQPRVLLQHEVLLRHLIFDRKNFNPRYGGMVGARGNAMNKRVMLEEV
jgi:hypothetical protein